jgi:hypothetical protein
VFEVAPLDEDDDDFEEDDDAPVDQPEGEDQHQSDVGA